MQIQMSFADAYRIRAKRYILFCLVFLFLAFLSVIFQIQQKNLALDLLAIIFSIFSLISLFHTVQNSYKAYFSE